VLALKQFFAGRHVTVFLIDDLTGGGGARDSHLHSLCHGVVTLEKMTLSFGAARRRLQVQKLRGVNFTAGYNDFEIRHGGLQVFPRLIATGQHAPFVGDPTPSGLTSLDALLGGGPLRGTCTLITGPAGSGKSTLALQYLDAACRRGEPVTIYQFDERAGTMLSRSAALGLPLQGHIDAGLLKLQQVDPAELSPGEFTTLVRREVMERGSRIVVIDSLSGYLSAMPEEEQLILQMHELLSFLNQQGVVTFLINPQHGLVGDMNSPGINISYIADAVLLLRFFEAEGRIRKAISVIKNRAGPHEDAIRELRIDPQGIRIGDPLTQFHGVLTGNPEYRGSGTPLMEDRSAGG
jgi:circadian clock protein KaiC